MSNPETVHGEGCGTGQRSGADGDVVLPKELHVILICPLLQQSPLHMRTTSDLDLKCLGLILALPLMSPCGLQSITLLA